MPVPLRVEALESRDLPATFGTPWPDGQHLGLSFAPDGTSIDGVASNLDALGPDARLAVLRAFQTWAIYANVNVGLVSDSGAAFGTGGAVQGDPRFGDIRVGGRPLAPDVLAVTAPYNLYDNYSGDIVLNTAADFGAGGYDLYTALLQEAGHALGIGNSPDPASAMYEFYQGPRAGLSAGDVASIRALYGARQPDRYEGAGGNDTLATATPNPVLTGPVTADLTTPTDVDVYKFTGGLLTNRVTVNLRAAGLSLVTARVELLDSSGRVLASGTAADPTHNDVTLSLGSVRAGQTYYVRVSGARGDEFSVGSYELDVKQSSLLTGLTDLVGGLLDDTGLNDTLATATHLLTGAPSVGPQTEYGADASFGSSRDVDVYTITVPPARSGAPVNLLLTVWGADGCVLNPWMEVTDAFGQKLDTEVIAADGNTTTLQVRGLEPGRPYFVKTFSDTQSVGGYHLSADLRTETVSVPELASGSLTAAAPTSRPFTLAQSGQVHLVLGAIGTSGSAEAVVTDAAGHEVGRFAANAGRGRSLDLMLSAGTYTVTVRSVSGAPIDFRLGIAIVTDPVGAQPEDPTTNPAPTSPPPEPVTQPADPTTTYSGDGSDPLPSQPSPDPTPSTAEPAPATEEESTTSGTITTEEPSDSAWWY
ncbi:MAG: matrixin family metalloprotease [Planctomycetes bacterium]|nr:matrixin family metalloprotease [Planctomycetota bacterium]